MSSRPPRGADGAAVASSVVASAGRSLRSPTDDGEWPAQFAETLAASQEPLDDEFEKALFDNLWELYAR